MKKINVGINGYGTIGKRVADLVSYQDDMNLVGVSKINPNLESNIAIKRGYNIYTDNKYKNKFKLYDIDIHGDIEDLISNSDIIVDCTPKNIGKEYKNIYEKYDVKVIWQGGENPNIASKSFNSISNYEELYGEQYARVVSCNTTGICRILYPISLKFNIKKVFVSIIRRGTDPRDIKSGPLNSIVLDPVSIPSHHALDVQKIIPNINIVTASLKVPTTLMHMHIFNIDIDENINIDDIISLLSKQPRINLIKNCTSTSELIEYSRDLLLPRNDIWENNIFLDSITITDKNIYLYQSIHQESIVIPENIDCIRSMMKLEKNKYDSINKTDNSICNRKI